MLNVEANLALCKRRDLTAQDTPVSGHQAAAELLWRRFSGLSTHILLLVKQLEIRVLRHWKSLLWIQLTDMDVASVKYVIYYEELVLAMHV